MFCVSYFSCLFVQILSGLLIHLYIENFSSLLVYLFGLNQELFDDIGSSYVLIKIMFLPIKIYFTTRIFIL